MKALVGKIATRRRPATGDRPRNRGNRRGPSPESGTTDTRAGGSGLLPRDGAQVVIIRCRKGSWVARAGGTPLIVCRVAGGADLHQAGRAALLGVRGARAAHDDPPRRSGNCARKRFPEAPSGFSRPRARREAGARGTCSDLEASRVSLLTRQWLVRPVSSSDTNAQLDHRSCHEQSALSCAVHRLARAESPHLPVAAAHGRTRRPQRSSAAGDVSQVSRHARLGRGRITAADRLEPRRPRRSRLRLAVEE
jgi:hypothetical protein